MKTPHKHAEVIKAWADGADIESSYPNRHGWMSAECPSWDLATEYRVRPHKWQAEHDAWVAGKQIQGRIVGDDDWHSLRVPNFGDSRFEFRIKPPAVRYRVALYIYSGGAPFTDTATDAEEEAMAQVDEAFVRWISDWQEVEV